MIRKINISSQREIHVQINEYKGRRELDIRTFITNPNPDGKYVNDEGEKCIGYTPKGVRVDPKFGEILAQTILDVVKGEKNG